VGGERYGEPDTVKRAFIDFDDLALHCVATADVDTPCVGESTWSIYVVADRRWWHIRRPQAEYTGLSYCGQEHFVAHREYIRVVMRRDYGFVEDLEW
jgi:hypothetical protein